jgi:hypothetical protein
LHRAHGTNLIQSLPPCNGLFAEHSFISAWKMPGEEMDHCWQPVFVLGSVVMLSVPILDSCVFVLDLVTMHRTKNVPQRKRRRRTNAGKSKL